MLLSPAKRHNQCHARGPGRQQIRDRQKFEDKRRQQQGMKANRPPRQNHGGNVENLVDERPAERAQQ